MNRSLPLFVAFVALLVLASLLAAWWLGPLAGLLVDGERRAAPYYLLQLDRTGNPDVLVPMVTEESGQLLGRGVLDHQLGGLVSRDEWAQMRVFSFEQGADFLRLATSESFRGARPRQNDRLLLLAETPPRLGTGSAWALWLFQRRDQQLLETDTALLSTASAYGGVSVWRADVEVAEGEAPWQAMHMLEFPSVEDAFNWHRDPETRTEVALMRTKYADTAALLFAR